MKIVFTKHAKAKFKFLAELGWDIKISEIKKCLQNPDKTQIGYLDRKIAVKGIDKNHDIRVVYDDQNGIISVISFYPVRKGR